MLARQNQQNAVKEEEHPELYGNLPLIQSKEVTDKKWIKLSEVEEHIDENVLVRCRVQDIKGKGKCCFLVLRQGYCTIQGTLFQSESIPKGMIKFTSKITKESIVDITANVSTVPQPITCASIQNLELHVNTIHVVSNAGEIPFQLEDAERSDAVVTNENKDLPRVNPDTKLDYRWIDLRIPSNIAIFRVQSGVGMLFRNYLIERDFVEIHTPKLQGGASEGGADVFKLNYFDKPACLAQSPQLHKQISTACSDFERVFEIGPVFRAENSNTQRHLCEFTGMDLEMVIKEHYHECLDLITNLFVYIFDGLNEKFKKEIDIIRKLYPAEPLEYPKKTVIIQFSEGVKMLHEAGLDIDPEGDLPY